MAILNIPEEIQVEIFMKLPAKSISVCRCVCKIWCTLLCNPKFVNNHLIHAIQTNKNPRLILSCRSIWLDTNPNVYSIDYATVLSSLSLSTSISLYDDCECNGALQMDYPFQCKKICCFKILGSCNGLICSSTTDGSGIPVGNSICIWNPTTREYKEISVPQYPLFEEESPNTVRYGFGHDSQIEDYKVVRISGYKNSPDCFKMQVYTLGSDSWNCINNPVSYSFIPFTNTHGLLFHGALHWIGRTSSYGVIVSFNISSERLVDVPLPEVTMVPPKCRVELDIIVCLLGDCLCLADAVSYIGCNIWVMQEYGVRESWTKQFTITHVPVRRNTFFKPIWSFENGEILIIVGWDFVLYNQISGKVRKLCFPDIARRGSLNIPPDNLESYVESLVSLNSRTYVEKMIRNWNLEESS